ncbi:MAG TPA: MFS transporter [Polyangiaceae bacterium]|nr:MFS transporter [Polyangiaceae bacterium]
MPEPAPARRASASLLLPVFLVVLTDVFGMTLVIPLMAIYAERMGATPLQATLLVSTFALCQLVSGPLLGTWSDRVGRKPVLLVSQIGTMLGFLLMARAEVLWLVYVSRAIDGATAGNLTTAQALIADHTPPERRSTAFAVIGIAFGLGFFIGPFATGYLSQFGLATPIYAAAGLSALGVVLTAALVPGGLPPARPAGPEGPGGRRLAPFAWGEYAGYFRRPGLGGRLVQFLLFALAFSLFTSGIALFAERRFFDWQGRLFGPREVGYLFAYAGFLGILLQGGLIGRLVRRFGEPALVRAGFAALGLGYFGLGLVEHVPAIVAVTTLNSFGHGVLRPALTGLISQRAEAHEQGVVLGLSQSLTSLSSVTAPALAGVLIGRGWLTAWAWVAAAFAVGGWALAARGRAARAEAAGAGAGV